MKNDTILILDLGIGNLGSIQNRIKKSGANSIISDRIDDIISAKKVIIAGVGFFDNAVNKIEELGIREVLVKKAQIEKVPFFGICLGMQLLTQSSDEGQLKGLSLIDAKTHSFEKEFGLKSINLRIPHMGWNYITKINESIYTKNIDNNFKYYFVHSYFVRCKNKENIALRAKYGIEFDAAIMKDNIFGTQFHPEKSHKFGKVLFKNFIEL